MRRLFSIILVSVISAWCFDELVINSRDDLINARVIAIGTIEPAEEFNGVQRQEVYIEQFRDILKKGISSCGYTVIDSAQIEIEPDLLISGKFLVMENGDAKKRVNFGFGPGRSGCKVYLKAVVPQNGKIVFELTDQRSSLRGEHVDELATNVAEEGHDIVKFFRELKAGNEQVPKQNFSCSDLENKKIAYCMLYVDQKRVTANILNAELQKMFMKKKIPVERIDFKTETDFRKIYAEKLEGTSIVKIPEEILVQLKSQSVDYLILMYNISDQRPSARVTRHIRFDNGMRTEILGKANKFSNIYCNLRLINIEENSSRLVADLWADDEECDDEVVDCMVNMIYNSISEHNGKKPVPCLKKKK